MANLKNAKELHEGLGGSVSVWRVMTGPTANAVAYRVEYEDGAGFGKLFDSLMEQGFMQNAPAENAPATLVNAALASEVDL